MGIADEHARADVAGKLADSLFTHFRILRQARHKGMARVVQPLIDARVAPRAIVRGLVTVGAHRASVIDAPDMRLAAVAGEPNMIEWEHKRILIGIREP